MAQIPVGASASARAFTSSISSFCCPVSASHAEKLPIPAPTFRPVCNVGRLAWPRRRSMSALKSSSAGYHDGFGGDGGDDCADNSRECSEGSGVARYGGGSSRGGERVIDIGTDTLTDIGESGGEDKGEDDETDIGTETDTGAENVTGADTVAVKASDTGTDTATDTGGVVLVPDCELSWLAALASSRSSESTERGG